MVFFGWLGFLIIVVIILRPLSFDITEFCWCAASERKYFHTCSVLLDVQFLSFTSIFRALLRSNMSFPGSTVDALLPFSFQRV